jgi:branched-chain amino acid transport system permease protein
LGAVYVLVATGFTLVQIPTGVFNFAQGAIVVGGSFLGYQWLTASKVPVGVALLLATSAGAVTGLLCEVVAVRPLRWVHGTVGTNSIVTTVGAATALIGLCGVKWGYQPLLVPFDGPTGTVHFAGTVARPVEILVVGFAIVSGVLLHLLFRRTRLGQACLAVAEDREAAMLRGVNVNMLSLAAFAAAGAFGGLTGFIIGPITYALPTLGDTLALGGFVALALGGQGSFIGGVAGGLLVGLVSTIAVRYIGANYDNLAVLALLLITLALRPSGLGGAAEARNV